MKTILSLLIMLAGFTFPVLSQDNPDTCSDGTRDNLNIFLDCGYCDFDFFRTNFTGVNYVNDRKDADVHVMVSEWGTGGGGAEFTMIFIGRGRFSSHRDTLIFSVPGTATEDELRQEMLDKLQLGLVPYLLKTPSRDRLILFFADETEKKPEKDPWKNWVFELSGAGGYSYQKYSTDINMSGILYISKVTPEIKLECTSAYSYFDMDFRYYDTTGEKLDDYSYRLIQRSFSNRTLFVKSLGKHAGIGGIFRFRTSDYSNLKYQGIIGPSFEYNVFDYDDASTRQLRFQYSVMYEHSLYLEMTRYNTLEEDNYLHELAVIFSYIKDWGSISTSVNAMNYLDDFSHFSAGIYSTAYIRIFKGLNLDLSFGATYDANQLSLRKEVPMNPGILLGGYELFSEFNYSYSVGISYRFGSIYNNVVNPRFGY